MVQLIEVQSTALRVGDVIYSVLERKYARIERIGADEIIAISGEGVDMIEFVFFPHQTFQLIIEIHDFAVRNAKRNYRR